MSNYIEFTVPGKAFSINRKSYRDARYFTAEYKDWLTGFMHELSEIDELKDFAHNFADIGGTFGIDITVRYPHHVFYNKSKQVSAKTFDVSNVEKIIIDAIFRDTLGIDDRHVVSMHSTKTVGATYCIEIALEFYPNT